MVFPFRLLAVAVCLGLSAGYHTLLNHSEKVEALWLRLDLVGIVRLILGDFGSGIWVVWWCEGWWRGVYWGRVRTCSAMDEVCDAVVMLVQIAALGTVTVVLVLSPRFPGLKWRTFRALTFLATGLSGLAPLGHGIAVFGFSQMLKQSGMPYYFAEGELMCLGALLYAVCWF